MDIDKIKALALAATKGPWQWWTSNSTLRLTGADGRDGGVLHGYVHSGVGDVSCNDANRAFIEASNPTAVLELIAEVERLRWEHATLSRGFGEVTESALELCAEVERLRSRFEYIEDHATTNRGGHGFAVSFFVPVDCENIGCGIDAAIAAYTKAGKDG